MASKGWNAHWERVRQGTLATIDLFQEDELGFAPAAGGCTIREIAVHIAHEEEIEIHHGLARLLADGPEPYPVARFPSKRGYCWNSAPRVPMERSPNEPTRHAMAKRMMRQPPPATRATELQLPVAPDFFTYVEA